jgi:hypothetical protein
MTESGVLLSPSKQHDLESMITSDMHLQARRVLDLPLSAKTKRTGDSATEGSVLRITDLPDPYHRYAGTAKSHSEITEAKVASPDIRDRQRLLITPSEYGLKIKDGEYAEVEIILKL